MVATFFYMIWVWEFHDWILKLTLDIVYIFDENIYWGESIKRTSICG